MLKKREKIKKKIKIYLGQMNKTLDELTEDDKKKIAEKIWPGTFFASDQKKIDRINKEIERILYRSY